MSIVRIDQELCNGCGICEMSCSMDVIRIDETSGKAVIRYREECVCCGFCETDCPRKAVSVSPERPVSPLVAW